MLRRPSAHYSEAIGIAKDLRDDAFVSYCRTLLAGFAFLHGDTQRAISLVDEALAAARRLGLGHDEMLLLCNRACYHLANGDANTARENAFSALILARDNDPAHVATAIQHIACSCVLEAEPNDAARLIGYVDEFRRQAGIVMSEPDARVLESMRSRLESCLDEQTYAELLREGARLNVDEAIVEAFRIAREPNELVIDKAE